MRHSDVSAIVTCGGHGTRMGASLQRYGCKSLLPIHGRTCLEYVLRALRDIGCTKYVLCVDRPELRSSVESISTALGLKSVVQLDSGISPAHAVCEAIELIETSSFFMVFGHHIVLRRHLAAMRVAAGSAVVSQFRESTETIRKISTTDGTGRCVRIRRGNPSSVLEPDEAYVEVPFLLELEPVLRGLAAASGSALQTPVTVDLQPDTILRFYSDIQAIKAEFGPEFQYPHELASVKADALANLQEEAAWKA